MIRRGGCRGIGGRGRDALLRLAARPPKPIGPDDDRSGFDCGRESLNQWFRRRAWDNQLANVSRTGVICDAETGAIIGYVALSAAQIGRAHLPRPAQRNRPDPLPAILLAQARRRPHAPGPGALPLARPFRPDHGGLPVARARLLLRAHPSPRRRRQRLLRPLRLRRPALRSPPGNGGANRGSGAGRVWEGVRRSSRTTPCVTAIGAVPRRLRTGRRG